MKKFKYIIIIIGLTFLINIGYGLYKNNIYFSIYENYNKIIQLLEILNNKKNKIEYQKNIIKGNQYKINKNNKKDIIIGNQYNNLYLGPKIINKEYNEDFLLMDYSEKEFLYGRDRIPVDFVKDKYVNKDIINTYKESNFLYKGKNINYLETLPKKGKKINKLVIFIHGMGGNKRWGFKDRTFGGNFNRVKNLIIKNNGIYISTEFSNFGRQGTDEIKHLIKIYKEKYKLNKLKVIVVCGSSGGEICWNLTFDQQNEGEVLVNGIFLLGSMINNNFNPSSFNNFPIFIGHGSKDSSIPYLSNKKFFTKIKKEYPKYPIKMELYKNGVHGTPIRMINWLKTLNRAFSIINK